MEKNKRDPFVNDSEGALCIVGFGVEREIKAERASIPVHCHSKSFLSCWQRTANIFAIMFL